MWAGDTINYDIYIYTYTYVCILGRVEGLPRCLFSLFSQLQMRPMRVPARDSCVQALPFRGPKATARLEAAACGADFFAAHMAVQSSAVGYVSKSMEHQQFTGTLSLRAAIFSLERRT